MIVMPKLGANDLVTNASHVVSLLRSGYHQATKPPRCLTFEAYHVHRTYLDQAELQAKERLSHMLWEQGIQST